MQTLKTRWPIALLLALYLLSLFTLGLGVRRHVLQASIGEQTDRAVPFTLESALQYRRVKMILDRWFLPERDLMIQQPEGIQPSVTYTVTVDYLQAAIARVLPWPGDLTARLRWIESGWFCLGVPLLALWGWRATGRWTAGLISGFLYAVAISSVQRSTGAELSTENTAFPFLIAHFWCRASVLRAASGHLRRRWTWASAICLAMAVVTWDLMQFYLFVWSGVGLWHVLRRRWTHDDPSAQVWRAEAIAVAVASVVVPYQRAHGVLFSPPLLAAAAGIVLLTRGAHTDASRLLPRWRPLAIALLLVVVGAIASGYYSNAYGHFLDLLWAKIRFHNVKPADPSLLTFDQRLMWTPALHSPTILLTIELLLVFCAASLPAVFAAGLRLRKQPGFNDQSVVVAFVLSLLAYTFFVRFHVFVACFGAMACGLWWGMASRREVRRPVVVFAWLSLCSFGEFAHTLRGPWQSAFVPPDLLKEVLDGRPSAALWGTREGLYHKEQMELTDWLEQHARPDTVLAGFGISGPIAAYAKCGIVVHPKFETRQARQKVKDYAEQLFTGTVKSFREWADAQGARYYVYGLGAFSTNEPTLQLRYMVNAMNASSNAPARLFEKAGDDGKYFRRQYSNRKYVVYRMLTVAEEVAAEVAAKRATEAFQRGELDAAETEAVKALEADPSRDDAQKILRHVFSLRNKGFPGGSSGER